MLEYFKKPVLFAQVTQLWRCERRGECKARIHVRNGVVLKKINLPIYHPNPCHLKAMRAVTLMKRRAENSDETTRCVVSNGLQDVCEASQESLLSIAAMKQKVRRSRKKLNKAPVRLSDFVDYFNHTGWV